MIDLGAFSTDLEGSGLLIIGVEARTAESNPRSTLELSKVDETPVETEEEYEDAMDNIEDLMSYEDMDL